MSAHEEPTGKTDEWYTPPEIFAALNETFDLDPSYPTGRTCYVPAHYAYRQADDGLNKPWFGFVWMNPPFGGRNGQVPWLQKLLDHGNGIGLVAARTSSGWFHKYAVKYDAMVFPNGKTKFFNEYGVRVKQPGTGIVLLGVGERAVSALARCKLGLYVTPHA